MKTMNPIILVLAIVTSLSCSNPEAGLGPNNEVGNSSSSQRVYFNAKIYTVNPDLPWSEAMVIDGTKILFVGTNAEAENFADENASRIDLQGKLVLPGFHDVHMHPMEVGATTTVFELDAFQTDAENYINSIRSAVDNFPNLPWVIGFGHSIETLFNASRNPLEIIDQAAQNTPVIIMEETSHSMWVNSKALQLAGITPSTENPTGGIIMKVNGELNGILIDNAGDIVFQRAVKDLNDAQGEHNGMIQYVLPLLAQNGITSVSDARTYWKRDQHKTWQRLETEGRLTARFNLGLWAYPEADDSEQIASLKFLFTNDENSLLRINQVKLYSDGITHNTTAALHSDYQVDYFHLPTNNGLNYFSQERIARYIQELEPVGFDFHIHTIGDRGVTEALNAVQQSGSSNGRHRLTHVEMIRPSDLARFAQLNVTADAQVAGDFTKPEHWAENSYLVGNTLSDNLIPIRSLTEANARLTLSSDWNVSTLNPFVGIQNAITRAPQNISLEQAIKAYTINGAYTMRQENKVGSLQAGKLADFVVLDRDIFSLSPNQISQTKVIRTVFNGQEIYRR